MNNPKGGGMYRRLGLWLGFLGAVCGVLAVLPSSVSAADTGGYPFSGKPCVHAPYAVYSTKINWCPNYDWGDRRNNTSRANVISPYGYYYRNCTDYVAWKLSTQGVGPAQYKGLGDAKRWAAPPAKNELRVDGMPTVGSAAVRTTGTYGHVAFVEAVDPSGAITVSEYNKRADGNFSVRTGTPATLGFTHFVHFEAYMPVPASPPPAPIPDPAPISSSTSHLESAPVPALTVPELEVPSEQIAPPPVPEATPSVQQSGEPDLPTHKPVDSGEQAPDQPRALHRNANPGTEVGAGQYLSVPAEAQALPDSLPARITTLDVAIVATHTQEQSNVAIESLYAAAQEGLAQAAGSMEDVSTDEHVPLPAAADKAASEPLPAMASALPVPHQWWRHAVQSPPSSLAGTSSQAADVARQVVTPLGYGTLCVLAAGTVVRESYGALSGVLLRWYIRRG